MLTHKQKRIIANNASDSRFDPALKYKSKEEEIAFYCQTGASNRKHFTIDKTKNKTYKPFSNK
jgi:hypothetical protein